MPDRRVPEEIIPDVNRVIGEFVCAWAVVEMALNYWIAIIYHDAGGKHEQAEIPFSLKQKIRFLRLCFNNISGLGPFCAEGRAILVRAKALAKTRDMLVHGVISDYTETDHMLLFIKLDLDKAKTMHVESKLHIPLVQLLKQGGEVINLGNTALRFAERLLEALIPEYKPHELLRRF